MCFTISRSRKIVAARSPDFFGSFAFLIPFLLCPLRSPPWSCQQSADTEPSSPRDQEHHFHLSHLQQRPFCFFCCKYQSADFHAFADRAWHHFFLFAHQTFY